MLMTGLTVWLLHRESDGLASGWPLQQQQQQESVSKHIPRVGDRRGETITSWTCSSRADDSLYAGDDIALGSATEKWFDEGVALVSSWHRAFRPHTHDEEGERRREGENGGDGCQLLAGRPDIIH